VGLLNPGGKALKRKLKKPKKKEAIKPKDKKKETND
tara:strand:+ start:4442 stop:4549 length:108 start_codon:yes stop_codon:yes gene_type:complete